MEPQVPLTLNYDEPLDDVKQYQRIIGRLLCLNLTRPNITFVTHKLSQFVSQPRTAHLKAAHQVLRYLKSNPGQGLFFPTSSPIQLRAFSDSDWASCADTRKSVTGFCIFLGNALVSWKTKKQATIFRSSMKAEHRALATTTSEILWLTQLLKDLHVPVPSPATIFCDITPPSLEIDCHFIRRKL